MKDKILEKLEDLNFKFAKHNKRFDAHDKRFDEHDKRFDLIDKKLAQHDKQFDAIFVKLAEHDAKFETLATKQDLANLREEVISGQDAMMTILTRLDQERLITHHTIQEHTKDIKLIKKHLKLA